MTMGVPGSGKSTWAARQRRALVVTLDALRTDPAARTDEAFDDARVAVMRGLRRGDVILDACSLTPRRRLAWLRLARDLSVRARLVIFATPQELCEARNAARGYPVAPARMDDYWAARALAEVAAPGEGWDEIVRVVGDG